MASKQLTATVRLNTNQAERKLKNIAKAIDALNRAVGKQTNAYKQVNQALSASEATTKRVKSATDKWANSQKKVNANLKSSKTILNDIGTKLRRIASTYLGVMGTKAIIGVSDTITRAENKLNYSTAKSLGSSGYNEDGTYSQATLDMTQNAMDKMYASSQKVRMGYTDMMNNVSKSMALAPDAFQGSIDNAIRFQEVMAEAYAIGGASEEEKSTSMYQLIQALGSGQLAGDELRSVREGAPLAYKAIEEFAQGVWNSEESLKDLASQGKVTADMVVAALLNAEGAAKQMDEAFAQTEQTFAQTWTQIKNAAVQAFRPISDELQRVLQKAIDNGLVQKLETAFATVAKVILIAFKVIENAIYWIADNWNWLQYIFYAGIAVLIAYLIKLAAIAIWTALVSFYNFLVANPFIVWIIAIGVLVAALVWMLNVCSDGCEFIIQLALIVAKAIIAVLAVVLAVYLATGTVMLSIPVLIGLLIVGIIAILIAVFVQFTGEIIGGALGIWEVIKAVCSWIGNGWENMCNSMAGFFWNAIADMLDGVDWLLKGINKIREALNMDTINIEGIRAKADSYKSKVEENDLDIGAAWDTGYTKGYAIGVGIQDKINGFGESIKGLANKGLNFDNKTSTLDKIGSKLGLDFSGFNFPNSSDPANNAGSSYKQPTAEDLLKGVNGIGDDTSKISDNMELAEEDLSFLRKVAEMEWRKEYTTNNIKIDMTNHNTVNGDGDLDGLVISLRDRLTEELDYLPHGVYA